MLRRIIATLFLLLSSTGSWAQVSVVKDIPYVDGSSDPKHRLDIYIPSGAKSAPVLFWIHGGQLMSGDRADSDNPPVGRRFAAAGFVTVVISYRLSPAVSHPAHIEDAARAFAWTVRNVSKHGGNPEQIFVSGHSAGGYLAALLAADDKYLEAEKLSPARIRAVLPVSGFYHIDRVAPDRPEYVWGADTKVWIEASPAHYVAKNLPPILLVYADADEPWRRQENTDYASELRGAGHMRVEIKEIRNRDHMGILYEMPNTNDETTLLLLDFMNRILNGR
jgi:acetyl esterase/lipase